MRPKINMTFPSFFKTVDCGDGDSLAAPIQDSEPEEGLHLQLDVTSDTSQFATNTAPKCAPETDTKSAIETASTPSEEKSSSSQPEKNKGRRIQVTTLQTFDS